MAGDEKKPLLLRDQLIRSFFGVGALRALSMPISLVVSIILARSLGPEGLGQYAFVLALIPLIALPIAGGLPQLLVREVGRVLHDKAWGRYRGLLRFSGTWIAAYSLPVVAAVWVLYAFDVFDEPGGRWLLLPVAIFLVPLSALIGVARGVVKGLGQVATSELPELLIRPAAFMVVVIALAMTGGLSPGSAVAGQVLAAVGAFAAGAWFMIRCQPEGVRSSSIQAAGGEWARALLPFSMIAIVSTLNAQIAIILLGLIETNEAVGVFQVANSGARVVIVSLTLVNMVIAPQVVKFWLERDRANLQLLSRQSARAAFVLAAPVALAFFVFGEQIIDFLFGAQYAQAAYGPLVVLTAGHLFNVVAGSVGLLLSMSDNEMDTLRSQVIAVAVNIVACLVLIPMYGALGAALGTAAGVIIWNLLMAIMVKRRLGIRSGAI